ncbi:MAG TPA: response regulator transcription factor [Bacteroidota bacterium]|nr:response regulator transcription factor [Bacteroidota bacterium]
MITVSIVEDDDDIRDSLALLIDATDGFSCVNTYRDCWSAVKGIDEQLTDVVLMDIGLPGMSGIEGIRRIKEKHPELDIIVLTVHENDEIVFEALCAGACGYLVKETPTARLLEAIREAHHGGAPMSTQIARMVVGSFQKKSEHLLTSRELEVLNQLCKGKSYKMIGESLFISEETVRRHLKSIYKKLEVHSKSEAVAKALKDKLV